MKTVTVMISIMLIALQASALNFDNDVPKDIQDQMVQDLAFANQIASTGQTPFHKEIYKEVSGSAYKSFFESHINSVGLDSCGGGAAVACVQPFFDPPEADRLVS